MRGMGFVLVLAACAVPACSNDDAVATADGAGEELREASLEVTGWARMPIPEVSGLGRRLVSGVPSYLAISDSAPAIVTFDVGPRGGIANIKKNDVSAVVGDAAPQWEAVAGDNTGNVFVLAEATDQILVFDPTLAQIIHTMQIRIPDDDPLAKAWRKDDNSHGEGMVLLSNGHVLIVKEKDPVAILELAAPGREAEGYSASLALGDGKFALPKGQISELVPVKTWLLKESQIYLATDVSELAVDFDGRLLLLSDQGRAIIRVERGLRPDEDKADLKSVFRLPKFVDKPEGLVLASGIPLVAIDQKDVGDTLFKVEPLPDPSAAAQ